MNLFFLIPIISVLGYCFILRSTLKITNASTFILSNIIIIFALYVCSLLDVLYPGYLIISFTGIIGALFGTFYYTYNKTWSSITTPSVIFFITGVIIIFFRDWNRVFLNWDEYSFWGFSALEYIRLDALPTPLTSSLDYISYLPGMPLFEYFFGRWSPNWEGIIFFAHDILTLSLITFFIQKDTWSNWKFCLFNFLVLNIGLYIFGFPGIGPYGSLYVDHILGLIFGCLIYTIYNQDILKPHRTYIINSLLFLLLLTKHIGIILGLIIVVCALLVYLLEKTSLKNILISTLSHITVVAFVKITWNWFIVKNSIIVNFGTSISTFIESLFSIFRDSEKLLFLKKFLAALVFQKISGIGFLPSEIYITPLMIFGLIGLCIYLKNKHLSTNNELLQKSIFLNLNILLLLGFIGYYSALFYIYAFRFSNFEQIMLCSYERYVSTYLIGWLSFCSIEYFKLYEKIERKKYWAIGILFGVLLFAKDFPRFFRKPPKNPPECVRIKTIASRLNHILPQERSHIFFIWQGDRGYHYNVFNSRISPHKLQTAEESWSFGTPYQYDGFSDIWTRNIDPMILSNNMCKYDFVAILHADENFWGKYGTLFDQQMGILYKIDHQNIDQPCKLLLK